MKKLIISIITTFVIGLFLSSCYDDKSTLATQTIDDVTIDTTGIKRELSVIQFSKLHLEPKIKKGGKDASNDPNLSFEWKLTTEAIASSLDFITIGEDVILDTTIYSPIAVTPYELWFVVTDNSTTLKTYMRWPLTVISDIGEGLVVADTRDELTTDLSLIMGEGITQDYSGEDLIRRNLYSAANGTPIQGLVKELTYTLTGWGDTRTLFATTSNSMLAIKVLGYKLTGINDELWGVPADKAYQPEILRNGKQSIVYVDKGKLFIQGRMGFSAFTWLGNPLPGDYIIDHHVSIDFEEQARMSWLLFYDQIHHKFWYYDHNDQKITDNYYNDPNGQFDPLNVPDLETKQADIGENSEAYFLMKNKVNSTYSIYTVKKYTYRYPGPSIPPAPGVKIDLPQGTHLEAALENSFVFCENQSVMYYATKSNIYGMTLYGNPSETSKWDVPSGEEITGLKIYRQACYAMDKSNGYDSNWNPVPFISTNILQLLCTTYNPVTKEGKVYTLPLINLGIGNIDLTKVKSRRGFGRILDVQSQGK